MLTMFQASMLALAMDIRYMDQEEALETICRYMRNNTRRDNATAGFAAGIMYGVHMERERRYQSKQKARQALDGDRT